MDCFGIGYEQYTELIVYLTTKNNLRRTGEWIKLLLQRSGANGEQYEIVLSLLHSERRPRTLMGPFPQDCIVTCLKKQDNDTNRWINTNVFFASLIRDLQIKEDNRMHIICRLRGALAETRVEYKWKSEIYRQIYKPISLPADKIYQWRSLETKCRIKSWVLERIVTGLHKKGISNGPHLVTLEERLHILNEPSANKEDNCNADEIELSYDEMAELELSLETISQDKAKKLRQLDAGRRRNYRLDETEEERIIRRNKNANRMARFRVGPLRVDSKEHNNEWNGRKESFEQAVERKQKDAERKRNMRKKETIDGKNERCRLERLQRGYTDTRRFVEERNKKYRQQAIEKGDEPQDVLGISSDGCMYRIKEKQ